jgi:hypothetical protein
MEEQNVFMRKMPPNVQVYQEVEARAFVESMIPLKFNNEYNIKDPKP